MLASLSKIVVVFGQICSNQVGFTSCGASLKSNQEVFDDLRNIHAIIVPTGIFCHAGNYWEFTGGHSWIKQRMISVLQHPAQHLLVHGVLAWSVPA